MRRLFYYFLSLVLLVFLSGGLIGGVSLFQALTHLEKLFTLSESFNVRVEFHTTFLQLREKLISSKDMEESLFLRENLKRTVTKCFQCHGNDKIARNVTSLKKFLSAPPTTDHKELRNRFRRLVSFSDIAYNDARMHFTNELATTKASVKYAGNILMITGFLMLGFFFVISRVSTRKFSRLEHSLLEKERILEEWALNWQHTFDTVKDLIAVIDKDKHIVLTNKQFQEVFGPISGKLLLQITGFEEAGSNKSLAPVPGKLEYEGHLYSVRIYEREENNGYVVVLTDITKEVRLEEELRQSEKMAAIGRMAAGIAHELRNPLTGVIGLSEILSEHLEDTNLKSMLSKIYKSGLRMENIIEQLLTFSRKTKPKREGLDINMLIEEVIDLLAESFSANNIILRKELGKLPYIRADRQMIESVLINLISNAIQAISDTGKGTAITISTKSLRDRIVIKISDDGPGIPEDIRDKIFEPFFTTKDIGKGTGLGLSICHNYITAHRGDIKVESSPGIGTTFTIELPLSERDSRKEEENSAQLA